jgi:hypothetical protein
LFFETGISDRKRSVLDKKLESDQWSEKTIVLSNHCVLARSRMLFVQNSGACSQ